MSASATDDDSHDLELTPMEHHNSNTAHHSLPLPEDMIVRGHDKQQQQQPGRSRRFRYAMYGVVALAGVAVAVIGLTLGLQTAKPKNTQQQQQLSSESGGSEGAEFIRTTDSPATPPIVTNTLDDVIDWLVTRDVVADRALLTTVGTPQNMAVQWLADVDTMGVPTDEDDETAIYLYTARYALTTFYYGLQGPNTWSSKIGFLQPDQDVCEWSALSTGVDDAANEIEAEWNGVFCNATTREIHAIDIELNGLQGSMPSEIGLLTTLKALDLEFNNIGGQLPDEFCRLTDLQHFWIQQNQLTGSLPSCMGDSVTELRSINVLDNLLLGGNLPNMCNMLFLESVVMDRCSFQGPVPPCEGWSNLQILSMADNSFTGTMPTQWTDNLPSLRELYLDGNQMQGNPLSVINTMWSLALLYIEENFFTGDLDATFAQNLSLLSVLDLSENEFTLAWGIFPNHLLALPELNVIDFSKNKLVGSIPDTISVQNKLFFLSVHENSMTGTIPPSIMNLRTLHHFDVSNNNLIGDIPDGLFNHPPLFYIFLAENPSLTAGPIPNMTYSTQIREVSLKNTNRNGPLPELNGYNDLYLLDVDDNDLTGTIPSTYGTLPFLRHLLLNSNIGLTGTLPQFTIAAENLGTVLLDKTSVTGDFNSICDLPTFQGITSISTEHIIIADCTEASSGITCDCCHCCTKDQEACSDPLVASLDWTWEYGFARESRNFALNATRLQKPKRTP